METNLRYRWLSTLARINNYWGLIKIKGTYELRTKKNERSFIYIINSKFNKIAK